MLLVPLSSNEAFSPTIQRLRKKLAALGISKSVDDSSASIGKRYSRNDELGTPFGITIDFQSIKDNTVTLRERDTTKQVRSDEDTICKAIQHMVNGAKTWSDIQQELPEFTSQEID